MNDDYKFCLDDVELARLGSEHVPDLANFHCGDEEMDAFLITEALDEQEKGLNSTTLLYYKGRLAAFVSVCCDAIPLNPVEREKADIPRAKVPAIKIARLGRSKVYINNGFGRFLIEVTKDMAYKLHLTSLGVRLLTLDAYPHRVEYYESQGFEKNLAVNRRGDGAVSMRSDIF